MVNMLKVIGGVFLFVMGYFLSVLLKYIFIDGDILGIMAGMGLDNTVHGIIWFGLFLVWACALLLIPIAVQVWGIMEMEDKTNSKIMNTAIAIISFLFGLLITVQLWRLSWPSTFADILSGQVILTSFYWIGLLCVWITAVIIAPVLSIIQARDT